jgi:hypothetical protein
MKVTARNDGKGTRNRELFSGDFVGCSWTSPSYQAGSSETYSLTARDEVGQWCRVDLNPDEINRLLGFIEQRRKKEAS